MAHALRGWQLRSGHVWDNRFGWIRKADVPRYEKGERFYQGRWISAEEDARLHADIQSGWDIETEHYTVRTNHSIEAGVRLGRKLEELYDVWGQLFVSLLRYPAADRRAMFNRWAPRVQLPRYKVVFFRERQQYNTASATPCPTSRNPMGFYMSGTAPGLFLRRPRTTTSGRCSTRRPISSSTSRGPSPDDVGESANCLDRRGHRRVHGVAAQGGRLLRARRPRRSADAGREYRLLVSNDQCVCTTWPGTPHHNRFLRHFKRHYRNIVAISGQCRRKLQCRRAACKTDFPISNSHCCRERPATQ